MAQIFQTTYYEAQLELGDATITAMVILFSLDNNASVKEADFVSNHNAEFTCEGDVITIKYTKC